jgi:hypothetical protein
MWEKRAESVITLPLRGEGGEKLAIMPLPYGDDSFALKFTKNLHFEVLSEL